MPKPDFIKGQTDPVQQQKFRGVSAFANLTDGEKKLMWGERVEESARGDVDAALHALRDSETPESRRTELEFELAHNYKRLAEALCLQGKYKEAVRCLEECAGTDEMRLRYNEIVEAIERDDGDECECEDDVDPRGPNGTVLTLSPHYVSDVVYVQSRDKWLPLVTCNKCGHKNVRQAPESLARAHSRRKEVREKFKGRSASEVMLALKRGQ